jgi:hypothetical protein
MDLMKQDKNMERIDKGWQAMNTLLDEKMPQKKRRRKFIFFWLFLAIGLLGSNMVFDNFINTHDVNIQEENFQVVTNSIVNIPTKKTDKSSNSKTNSESIEVSNTEIKSVTEESFPSDIRKKSITESTNTKSISSIKENDKKVNQRVIIESKSSNRTSIPVTKPQDQKEIKAVDQKIEIQKQIDIKRIIEINKPQKPLASFDQELQLNNDNISIDNIVTTEDKLANQKTKSKNKLAGIALLPSIIVASKLNYDYPIIAIAHDRLIDPVKSRRANSFNLNYGLKTSGTYLTNIKAYGVSPSAFVEFEKNAKWGIGFEIMSSFVTRANDSTDALRDPILNTDGNPDGIGAPIGLEDNEFLDAQIISEIDRSKVISAYTTNFNSIGLNLYSFFNINSRLRLSLGLGLEQFYGTKSLNNVYVLGNDFAANSYDPRLSTYLFSYSKIIANANIGLSYSISNKMNVFANYNYGLANLVEEIDLEIKTNRVNLGLSYTF